MNETQVSCFLAAAAADSFAAAADSLFMTAPTFGRHISSLEQELGFPLFFRGWKNHQLTPAGQIMYEGFVRLQNDYRQVISVAAKASSMLSGHLSVGMLEGQLVDESIRTMFQNFQETYPGITVELRRYSFRSMMQELQNGELDVGITLSVELSNFPSLASHPLYRLNNEIVVSNKNPLAGRLGLTLADFSEETFIEVERRDSEIISGLMTESCRQAGFDPKVLTVPDLRSQILAVELGQGIAAFNVCHQTCHHPALTHIPVPELPPVEFSAAWSTPVINPAVAYFSNIIQAFFQY